MTFEPMTFEEMEAAVRRGIQLLDKVRPNWRRWISWEFLNQRFCRECALGQLYGGYWTGLERVNLTSRDAVQYGFDVPTSVIYSGEASAQLHFRQLTNLWLQLGRDLPLYIAPEDRL